MWCHRGHILTSPRYICQVTVHKRKTAPLMLWHEVKVPIRSIFWCLVSKINHFPANMRKNTPEAQRILHSNVEKIWNAVFLLEWKDVKKKQPKTFNLYNLLQLLCTSKEFSNPPLCDVTRTNNNLYSLFRLILEKKKMPIKEIEQNCIRIVS